MSFEGESSVIGWISYSIGNIEISSIYESDFPLIKDDLVKMDSSSCRTYCSQRQATAGEEIVFYFGIKEKIFQKFDEASLLEKRLNR